MSATLIRTEAEWRAIVDGTSRFYDPMPVRYPLLALCPSGAPAVFVYVDDALKLLGASEPGARLRRAALHFEYLRSALDEGKDGEYIDDLASVRGALDAAAEVT